MIKCCKDCTRREIGCHGKCADYAADRKVHDAERDVRRAERTAEDILAGYAVRGQIKAYRKIRENKKNKIGGI